MLRPYRHWRTLHSIPLPSYALRLPICASRGVIGMPASAACRVGGRRTCRQARVSSYSIGRLDDVASRHLRDNHERHAGTVPL